MTNHVGTAEPHAWQTGPLPAYPQADQTGLHAWQTVQALQNGENNPGAGPRAWQTVLDYIESLLQRGTLAPGDRLPGERALVAQLGVGRSSVREALRVLDVLGLIHTRSGSGPSSGATIVAAPRGGMSALMRLHVAVNGFPVADIVRTRLILETALAIDLARPTPPPTPHPPPPPGPPPPPPPRRGGGTLWGIGCPRAARGRVPRTRRRVPPRARRGIRQSGHHRDNGGPALEHRKLRARRDETPPRLERNSIPTAGRAPRHPRGHHRTGYLSSWFAHPPTHFELLQRNLRRHPAQWFTRAPRCHPPDHTPTRRYRTWLSASFPALPNSPNSCDSKLPPLTRCAAASTARSQSTTYETSHSAAPRAPRSTTPRVPRRANCRSPGHGKRLRMSNSTPRFCGACRLLTRVARCSAVRARCRLGSRRPGSPDSCRPRARSPEHRPRLRQASLLLCQHLGRPPSKILKPLTPPP